MMSYVGKNGEFNYMKWLDADEVLKLSAAILTEKSFQVQWEWEHGTRSEIFLFWVFTDDNRCIMNFGIRVNRQSRYAVIHGLYELEKEGKNICEKIF